MREVLKVSGMSCEHCVASIERALADKNVNAKVDLANQSVEVLYPQTVTKDEIVETIEDLGYEVK